MPVMLSGVDLSDPSRIFALYCFINYSGWRCAILQGNEEMLLMILDGLLGSVLQDRQVLLFCRPWMQDFGCCKAGELLPQGVDCNIIRYKWAERLFFLKGQSCRNFE
jgi:hypothetical protein